MTIPFDNINRAALAQYSSLLKSWLPGGALHGKEFKVGSIRGEPGQSLSINTQSGVWSDFAAGISGSDPISLYAAVHGLKQGEAAKVLADSLGLDTTAPQAATAAPPPSDDWTPGTPPEGAGAPLFREFDHVYTYRDADGKPVRYIARKDATAEARKKFVPFTWGMLAGKIGWHKKQATDRLPYNIDQIISRPFDEIVIVEGEKAADAASATFPDYITTTWSGGSSTVAGTDWRLLQDRSVVIWPDNDDPGHKAAAQLAKILQPIAASIVILRIKDLPPGADAADIQPDDPNKFIYDRTPGVEPEIIQPSETQLTYRSQLQKSDNGNLIANLANVMLILRNNPQLQFIVARDEMARLIYVKNQIPGTVNATPYPLRDCDVSAVQEWVQRNTGPRNIGTQIVYQALELRSWELSYHPVKDYLSSLKWDGKPRVQTWLTYYMGCEPTSDNQREYYNKIGEMFLISMVARIFRPGCKCDYALIFEGEQGDKKSTACAILAGEWFSDSLPADIGHKDAAQHLNGKWLIEIGEMSAFSKSESAALKAFLTRTVEKYRPPHGRAEVVEPRQCVFIGTTNKKAYLRDETGGRRFWPVLTGASIAIDDLARDRDQLLAEAVHLFQSSVAWWPDRDFERRYIKPEQEEKFEVDAWEEPIRDYLSGRYDTSLIDIAKQAIYLEVSRIGTADQRRIINILERLRWKKGSRQSTGFRWYPVENQRQSGDVAV